MRWIRRLTWFAGALALLWLVLWLGVPPLLQWQAQQRLGELLGRGVAIGKVEFSPWSLRLAVSDISIAAAPGAASSEPQLQIGAIRADFDARSLLHWAPVVESLQIEAPRARLARTAPGHYDIDDLLQRLAPRPGEPASQTQRFALYNVELRDGAFVFDDRPAGREHRLDSLQLTLPFVSNLAADVQVKVEPRVAFTLNGAAFDSGAQALPFTPERNGTLSLKVDGLDLAPYLGYQPAALPLRVTHGKLAADLQIVFAAPQSAAPSVSVRGTVAGEAITVTAAGGAPLAEVGKVSLGMQDVQPLARKAMLGAIEIDGLVAHVARNADGSIDVLRLFDAAPDAARPADAVRVASAASAASAAGAAATASAAGATAEPAASAASAASAPSAASAAAETAWQLGIDSVALSNAQVVWNDAAVQPPLAFVLADVAFKAQRVQLPAQAPAPFSLDAVVRPQGKPGTSLASVALDGQASASAATVNMKLAGVSLAALAPYLSLAPDATIAGTGALRGTLDWSAQSGDKPQRLVARIAELGLEQLKAGTAPKAGSEIVAVERARLSDAEVDLGTAKVEIGAIDVDRPQLDLERSAQGAWNVMALAGATPLSQDPRAATRAAASLPWQVALRELRVEGGRVRLADGVPAAARAAEKAEPVRLDLDRMRLAVQDVRLDGARLVSQPRVVLHSQVRAPADGARSANGALEWRGSFGVEPTMANGNLRVERFPLHAVQDYVPHDLGVRLARADASFDGSVALKEAGEAGFDVDAGGDVRLTDVMLKSVPLPNEAQLSEADRELLSWRAFDLKRMKVTLRPGAVPKLAVGDAKLADFFVRLILTEDGRFNLRDVTDRPDPAKTAAATAAPAPAATPAPSAPASAARTGQAAPASGPPLELDLGGVELVNGRIDYSDRFVKPNYSAALTELNGRIGAFRTGSGEPAKLELAGRVAGTGQIEVAGHLNPVAVPRELDITAKATDIELAPLSPYARRYAGYPIERGKLSLDVHYKVGRDDRLEASHQVILNQLTFGERVESPDATKLPVLLAVSLLKDANGVIDINLPVSGTLSDPQFSLGGVILKVIVNLLTKAITAPFTLLAGGGGHDLSVVEFKPGTSVPTQDGVQTIAKVAKALADRPALKLTVTGEADPVAERGALSQAMLDARLVQEQQREAQDASDKPGGDPGAAATLTAEERARLLKAVYKETDIPDKPRNLIGMQSDVEPEKMEAMLLGQMNVGPEAMRELAMQRGLVVRDALVAKGLAADRLFLGAPRMHGGTDNAAARGATGGIEREATGVAAKAGGGGASAASSGTAANGGGSKTTPGGAWTPRAKLDLSAK